MRLGGIFERFGKKADIFHLGSPWVKHSKV